MHFTEIIIDDEVTLMLKLKVAMEIIEELASEFTTQDNYRNKIYCRYCYADIDKEKHSGDCVILSARRFLQGHE